MKKHKINKMKKHKINKPVKIQENEYFFPYHHIPNFVNGYGVRRSRHWNSSLEYICRLKHILDIVEKLNPTSILEVGCGDGRIIGSLSSVSVRVGYDISVRALLFAQAFYPDVMFTEKLNDHDTDFDLVILSEVIEHIPDEKIKDFLCQCISRLSVGSYLLISVPTKNLPIISKHFRHYDKQSLLNAVFTSTRKMNLISIEYINVKSNLVSLYNKITLNRYWTIDIQWLNKVVLNYMMKLTKNAKKK